MAVSALSLVFCAPAVSAQAPVTNEARILTFTDEVPCPPQEDVAPGTHTVRHPVRRHKRLLHKAAAPVHRRRHVVAAKPHVLAKHVVRRRRPVLVHVAAPTSPTRCTVLRRERLTTASFALTPDVAVLTPIADTVEPGGPALVSLTSGRPALPNVVNPTAGGGSTGTVGGVGSVSAAPEPEQWVLMLFGVGALGASLRRRSRKRGFS